MSFLERFVLATDDEMERFEQTGDVDWNDDLIRQRIFDYFPNRAWAQLYADYIFDEAVEPEVPEFPVEMLAYIRGRDNFTAVAAIPLDRIPRFARK
jgi:hypothetical protein